MPIIPEGITQIIANEYFIKLKPTIVNPIIFSRFPINPKNTRVPTIASLDNYFLITSTPRIGAMTPTNIFKAPVINPRGKNPQ